MDPSTAIIVLALNLISSGGLFFLIARYMPPHSGLAAFGAAATVFGSAYVVRQVAGPQAPSAVGVLVDTAMILGVLLFIGGVRQFTGRTAFRRWLVAATLLGYAAAHAAILVHWGLQGRHVLLNAALGVLYVALAVVATLGARREAASLRQPLRLLALLVGVLGVMTAARGAYIGLHGADVIFKGTVAQAYYAYATFATVLLAPNLLWMVFVRLNRQLAELASRDALTRLLNRNGLDDALRHHFNARRREAISWLQVDIDHFKRINDVHGHATGDATLRSVADTLTRLVRAGDFVARTGGEEFLIGCVGADAATASALGERLRAGVEALRIPAPGGSEPVRCTVSVGVSQPFGELTQWEAAARTADRALYAAKEGGRNRVVCQV